MMTLSHNGSSRPIQIHLIVVALIVMVHSDDKVNDGVALMCPLNWIAQGHGWYASPYRKENQTNSVGISEDLNYLLSDRNLYNPSEHKVCLICENESHDHQKWIEICVTNTSMDQAEHWHYQMSKCSDTPKPQLDPLHSWCRKETLIGIYVKTSWKTLRSRLVTIDPIYQMRMKSSYTKSIQQNKHITLMCPEGFTVVNEEVHNLMCDSAVKESFCIVCTFHDILVSICLPKNCTNINQFQHFNELTIRNRSFQLNETLKKTHPDSTNMKICGVEVTFLQPMYFIDCNDESSDEISHHHPIQIFQISIGILTTIVIVLILALIAILLKLKTLLNEAKDIRAKNETDNDEQIYVYTSVGGERDNL